MARGGKRTHRTTGQAPLSVHRRDFLKESAAAGIGGVAAAAGLAPATVSAQAATWTHEVDLVVIGAGPGGMSAAIEARKRGASVIILEQNFDIGGRAMMSGGNLYIGGGNRYEAATKRDFSSEKLFGDWTRTDMPMGRFSDRELARTWADSSLDLFNFFDKESFVSS